MMMEKNEELLLDESKMNPENKSFPKLALFNGKVLPPPPPKVKSEEDGVTTTGFSFHCHFVHFFFPLSNFYFLFKVTKRPLSGRLSKEEEQVSERFSQILTVTKGSVPDDLLEDSDDSEEELSPSETNSSTSNRTSNSSQSTINQPSIINDSPVNESSTNEKKIIETNPQEPITLQRKNSNEMYTPIPFAPPRTVKLFFFFFFFSGNQKI